MAHLNAQLPTMQILCTVLPDCRPALVVGIQMRLGNEEDKRAEWLLKAGVELPKEVPYYLDVRSSEDVDAPMVTVPSYCVLSSSGMNIQPATAKNGIGQKVLRSLAGDLDGSTFHFWGKRTFSIHQLQHNEEQQQQQQQQKGSPWQTAEDLARQTAENDEQQPLNLGPAVKLSELQDDMTSAARQRCVPNADLKSFLSTLHFDGRSHGQQSQDEQQLGPACAPILMRRAPVLIATQGTLSRCKAATPDKNPEQQRESVQIRAAEQCDAAFKAPKAPAKPALLARKRPGTALKAKAPPAQFPRTDAAPRQRMPGAPQQTVQAPAEHIPGVAAQALPASAKPKAPQPSTTPGAAAGGGGGRSAAPAAKKAAKQAKTDEAGAAAEAKAPRSRTKAADLDLAAVEAKVKAKHAERQLDKLSIPEIKCYLKAKKLPVGGKKCDLVTRLAECLNGGK
ncbi:hypothetical protein COCOBI_01-4890 [Coccomyxa sp. Obi]|nr:hypothetical protein COCOBI_01-4890 [Coccomyxa sp. Obi]